jgi:hypothetical protein
MAEADKSVTHHSPLIPTQIGRFADFEGLINLCDPIYRKAWTG